jgi:hypothetical protein
MSLYYVKLNKTRFATSDAQNDTIARAMRIWKPKLTGEGSPKGFSVQRIRVTKAVAISDLPGAEIARYFREHPSVAKDLLGESHDKVRVRL